MTPSRTPWKVGNVVWVKGKITAIGIDGINCEGQHCVEFDLQNHGKFWAGQLRRTRPIPRRKK